MMIDDDDVALGRAPPHLGDKAAVKLAAFLPGASLGPGVELVPNRARLGQFREFRAVPRPRGFLPCRARPTACAICNCPRRNSYAGCVFDSKPPGAKNW